MYAKHYLRQARCFVHLEQLGHLRVESWCFDILEEESRDPLPQPLQTGGLKSPSH